MIIYKNVLQQLKECGYSTSRIRSENLLSQSTLQHIRENKAISTETLNVICRLTNLPVECFIEYKRP